MLSRRLLTAAFSAVALAIALGGPAAAQKYPERPITLIVPWAAGGGADLVSRILAAGLEKEIRAARQRRQPHRRQRRHRPHRHHDGGPRRLHLRRRDV